MPDPSKPSIIARGVEHAIRSLCELWGYAIDEETALPDADDLQPVAGEIEASPDEDTSSGPNAAERIDTDELGVDEDEGVAAREDDIEAAVHREALRHLLEVAEELHAHAREPGARPPSRPV